MQNQILGERTQMQYDHIWETADKYSVDYDFNELLDQINSSDFFRPFSERLLTFYNEIRQVNYTADEAIADLQRCNIALSRGTLNNWFAGKTEPKFGDKDRQSMFIVAFALELDVAQTERLFHKVFLDKAFNKRNRNEFIYLYCINNKKPLSVAEGLIEDLKLTDKSITATDATIQTQFLADAAMRDIDENELLEYISTHPHNFSLNNTAALKKREELVHKLTGDKNNSGLAQQEHDRHPELADDKNKDKTSVDFMLSVLKGADFAQKDNTEITSIRDKFPQRKEIYNQFPDKQTISKKDPASYTLRKDIILLQFYSYWVADFLSRQELGEYDGFVEELNDVLFDCGFSPLYIGNPYDWLFLYCSACEKPLDVFRGILAPD
jgi:hypothetical protein